MQVIDLRLVLEEGTSIDGLLDHLGRETEDILGAALLVNNGFGHLLPSTDHRRCAIPFGDPSNVAVQNAIDFPDGHRA